MSTYFTYLWIILSSVAKISLLPPANEVCEGYVFTPVCQSFCSGGGGLHPGGSALREFCIRGVCIQEVYIWHAFLFERKKTRKLYPLTNTFAMNMLCINVISNVENVTQNYLCYS